MPICTALLPTQSFPQFPVMLGIPGHWEWLIILVLVLIFFGNRIPGLAKSLGGGIHEFKKGLKEGEGDGKGGDAAPPAAQSGTPSGTQRDAKSGPGEGA